AARQPLGMGTRARRSLLKGAAHPVRIGACPYGSAAEAPLALLERPYRPKEVQLAKRRPVDVGEVELAVAALPGQEAAQAHLAARADDQLRVAVLRRVQVARDRLCVDMVGHLIGRNLSRRQRP